VVTGTEVLEGRVRDENGGAVAASLASAGVQVERITVVGDGLDDIRAAVREALDADPDLLVTTGGLGPTHDDRTMEAVALATGRPLHVDPHALVMVRHALAAVPARSSEAAREEGARKQATMPEGATVIPPPGTAPGAVVQADRTVVVVLPGPPWECWAAWDRAREVPAVAAVASGGHAGAPVEIRMAGVVESEFMEALAGHDHEHAGLVVGVCARPGELEVTVRPPGEAAVAFVEYLDLRFPRAIFSRDGAGVEQVVGALLSEAGATAGTAESCTGGMVGARLTQVPGSSSWFRGGVVAYSNAVKQSVLGVPAAMIDAHGAVSEPVAQVMAEGALSALDCDWAVGITGVAGPGGGTADKPVGLVYVAVAGPSGAFVRELRLHGDRERVRMRASTIALHLLREALSA